MPLNLGQLKRHARRYVETRAHAKVKGVRFWYDEFELRVGDSLRRSIDRGLASSQHGVVVLSRSFFRKNWPQRELDGLVALEVAEKSAILPVGHRVTKNEVLSYSPTLADKVAVSTVGKSVRRIATAIAEAIDL